MSEHNKLNNMENQPKWVHYATILAPHIKTIFTDESEVKIDIEELDSEENLQAFFHALATVVPCEIFNRLIGDKKHHLEFNHVANTLCMKFMKIKNDSESK